MKKISSKQLAEKYAKEIWKGGSRIFDKEENYAKADFLAGWTARGKADQDIVIDHGCKGNIENSTILYERLGELDEQT